MKSTRTYHWADRELEVGRRTLVMGIVNVTPDSFSDGGCFRQVEAAVRHAHQLIADGADILDIGGESTRPYGNNQPVSAEEEMERVLPVLERLLREVAVPISLDTYKPETAEAALKLGVHMINDVWGLQKDPAMAAIVAKYQVPVIVMHNQAQPGYQDLLAEVSAFLLKSIQIAGQAGIDKKNIIIDPGIGFGKTRTDNLRLIRHLEQLKALECPILLGTSRKAFIGTTLGGLLPGERVEGTAATVAVGIANGADIVRVHDVKEMARVARMTDALIREELG
ncbi:dihydropteroate synthase [Anaerospora hongkongensis]|uniref:Dihydropteroate synthase n=1 Tax=Anaerospora hongkongensis TaxID=244830 RepID=A0A4R1Q339_9FIRM|nr:dihydropteroate synthase [Anaerospora hongkongensis]TCL38240.1 dihydropteroate synthase [Anaerospora hongkongensis]